MHTFLAGSGMGALGTKMPLITPKIFLSETSCSLNQNTWALFLPAMVMNIVDFPTPLLPSTPPHPNLTPYQTVTFQLPGRGAAGNHIHILLHCLRAVNWPNVRESSSTTVFISTLSVGPIRVCLSLIANKSLNYVGRVKAERH